MDEAAALMPLIECYLETAMRFMSRLRSEFGVTNLLAAVHEGQIPREGTLDDGFSYEFHGVGCRAGEHDVEIEVDFGPDGRSDGFDAWRLSLFAAQIKGPPRFTDADTVQVLLDQLKKEGIIKKPGWSPSRGLYYLTRDG